jgi:PEGA domain/Tetratricopeptide repeat
MTSTKVLVALAAILLCAPVAHARDEGLAEAKAHFRLGRSFFEAKAYERAIAEYEAAYKAKPLPEFLFNIGQTLRELKQREKAIEMYNRFLVKESEGPAAEEARKWVVSLTLELDNEAKARAAQAERDRIEREQHRPGRLRVTTRPQGAAVRVDGETAPRGVAPVELELPPGEHRIVAELGRFSPAEGTAVVPPGGVTELALTLQPLEEPCPPGQVRGVDTHGQCCWPGQVWDGARCVGVPTQCLPTFEASVATQSCECAGGRVQLEGPPPHCCWPGQAWSVGMNACVGVPQCPRAMFIEDNECVRETRVEQSKREREMAVFSARKLRGVRFELAPEIVALRFGTSKLTLSSSTQGQITAGGSGAAGDGVALLLHLGVRVPLSPRWDLAAAGTLGVGAFSGQPTSFSFETTNATFAPSGDYSTQMSYSSGPTVFFGADVAMHARPLAAWSRWIVILGARVLGTIGPGVAKGSTTCVSSSCMSSSNVPSVSARSDVDVFLGPLIGTGVAVGPKQQLELAVQVALGSSVAVPTFVYTAGPCVYIAF